MPETEIEKLRRINSELKIELIKSSQRVVKLKNSVIPAIKLINQYRWELKKLEQEKEIW